MAEVELWRPVGGLGVYEVSDHGRIRWARTLRIKHPTRAASGFWVVNLYAGGRTSVRNVHSIVAEAFLGTLPTGFMVLHRDRNRGNNLLSNLAYSPLRNRHAGGEARRDLDHPKLTNEQVTEIRRRARMGASSTSLAREFGVSVPHVSQIKHNRKRGSS